MEELICQREAEYDVLRNEVRCPQCSSFLIDPVIYMNFKHGHRMYCKKPHMLSGYALESFELKRAKPILRYGLEPTQLYFPGSDGYFPESVAEKAHKLLSAIHRRTDYFGDGAKLNSQTQVALAYAANEKEFRSLISLLEEQRLIRANKTQLCEISVTMTADGFTAVQKEPLLPPLTVFISSTCYDLTDLRGELATELESQDCIVKLSEDPERFSVDPTADSIESCLLNLRSSDVVICILDRRYGSLLGTGPNADLSATHVEIRDALERKQPVFTFVRAKAWQEYQQLKSNPDFNTKWIDSKNKDRWLKLASELVDFARAQGMHSNWFDEFRTSVDLKLLVSKRLMQFRHLLLGRFQYVSFHAPSRRVRLSEGELVERLRKVADYVSAIIVHPDIIENAAEWKRLEDFLVIENMDQRKSGGRNAREIQRYFDELPKARFCFDIGHARQVDPTLSIGVEMLRAFADRLAEIHISEVDASSEHVAISSAARDSYREIASLIPKSIPAIVESVVGEDEIDDELQMAKASLGD